MKTHFWILIIVVVIGVLSCKKKSTNITDTPSQDSSQLVVQDSVYPPYQLIDPEEFNQKLNNTKGINTIQDVGTLYYPISATEGSEKLSSFVKEFKEYTEVTILHENIPDDSISGIKITMDVKQNGTKWHVLRIRKSFKCYSGRGHAMYNTTPCS